MSSGFRILACAAWNGKLSREKASAESFVYSEGLVLEYSSNQAWMGSLSRLPQPVREINEL